MDSEALGRYDLADVEKYIGIVKVPSTRQQQLLVRREPEPAAGGEAALWNLLAHTHGQRLQSHLQHSSKILQHARAFPARPTRNVELLEEQAEEPAAMDGRKAAGGAANLHAEGWSD